MNAMTWSQFQLQVISHKCILRNMAQNERPLKTGSTIEVAQFGTGLLKSDERCKSSLYKHFSAFALNP
jgi:hypothetical protein